MCPRQTSSQRNNGSAGQPKEITANRVVSPSALFDERAGAELRDRLPQLRLGVHHDRSIPGDRLLERFSRHEQEPDALAARLYHDLVSAVEQHERSVSRFVAPYLV